MRNLFHIFLVSRDTRMYHSTFLLKLTKARPGNMTKLLYSLEALSSSTDFRFPIVVILVNS